MVAVITTLLGNQGDPIEMTVIATTAIPLGTIMTIDSSPQTATAADTDGDYIIGIAATEKTATDGVTKMSCITHCIAELSTKAGGSATLGKPVKIDGANTVDVADASTMDKSMEAFAISLETLGASATGAFLINI